MKHYSVLLDEIIEGLNIRSDGIYVDATLGYGGMSKKVLEQLDTGKLICIDQDEEAIKYSEELLSKVGSNYKIVKDNFSNIDKILNNLNIKNIDGIIFDLGFSSPQIDDENRGFSFMSDAPLDMRMNLSNKLNAQTIINEYPEEKLIKIFYEYGEEDFSKVIAKKIVEKRKEKEITRTLELVSIIQSATGANYFYKKHPERRIFQALRIEVNNELEVLKEALHKSIDLLNTKGRICVISFHSLEDRIVKNIFREYSEVDEVFKGLPSIPLEYQPKLKIINKKPIEASKKELEENTRSHSAKLRIGERL